MATILRAVFDNNLLLVHEDISEFMSDAQKFNVINGSWTGIYDNGAYTHYERDDRDEPIDVVVYRNIDYAGDYEKTINDFRDTLPRRYK